MNIKMIFLMIFVILAGWFGRKKYLYYYQTTPPTIIINGVTHDKGYDKDCAITVKIQDAYGLASVDIVFDGKSVLQNNAVGKKTVEHNINVSAQDPSMQGKHTIRVIAIDSTKNSNKSESFLDFYIDTVPMQVFLIKESGYCVDQGSCLRVAVQSNKLVRSIKAQALHNDYSMYPESKHSTIYETFIPVECEQEAGEYVCSLEVIDYLGVKKILECTFKVCPVAFKKRVLNIQGNKLQSELEFTNLQEADLEAMMESFAKNSVQEKLWTGVFEVPIVSKGITTDFGVIRTSQERGRKVHKALDLVADPKSVVWASNNGIVVLKDRFTHTGNTVVIDHGFGLISLYCHLLDYANVAVGQFVKKGYPLGRMGMTGYASGDHLHWEVRLNNIGVQPMQWTEKF